MIVCPDGTFWSGIWIVARVHSERAPKVGAYLALHETKTEPSYRQGLITDWRRGTRAEGKIGEGMEFLVRPRTAPTTGSALGRGKRVTYGAVEIAARWRSVSSPPARGSQPRRSLFLST